MKRNLLMRKQALGAALMLAGVLAAGSAIAQPPPGGPPPFGGPGGRFGRPGGGPISVADVPIEALTAGLDLSASQTARIKEIQKQDHEERDDLMFQPAGGGGRPDPEVIQQAMQKIQALNKKTEDRVKPLLSTEQKKKLPELLSEVDAMRAGGIPAELYGPLQLTTAQKQRIVQISKQSRKQMQLRMDEARSSGDFQSMRQVMQENRQQSRDRIQAVLTPEQKAIVAKYIQDHPRPRRGPGGPPPDGGPGGPPPGGGPGGA